MGVGGLHTCKGEWLEGGLSGLQPPGLLGPCNLPIQCECHLPQEKSLVLVTAAAVAGHERGHEATTIAPSPDPSWHTGTMFSFKAVGLLANMRARRCWPCSRVMWTATSGWTALMPGGARWSRACWCTSLCSHQQGSAQQVRDSIKLFLPKCLLLSKQPEFGCLHVQGQGLQRDWRALLQGGRCMHCATSRHVCVCVCVCTNTCLCVFSKLSTGMCVSGTGQCIGVEAKQWRRARVVAQVAVCLTTPPACSCSC